MDQEFILETWKSAIKRPWQDTYQSLAPLFEQGALSSARKIELYTPYVVIEPHNNTTKKNLIFANLNNPSIQSRLLTSPASIKSIHFLTLSFENIYGRKQITLRLYINAPSQNRVFDVPARYFYKKVPNGVIIKQLVATNKLNKIDTMMKELIQYGHKFYYLNC